MSPIHVNIKQKQFINQQWHNSLKTEHILPYAKIKTERPEDKTGLSEVIILNFFYDT